jgi:Uma2 family endonuclease
VKDFAAEDALRYSGGELMSRIHKKLFTVDDCCKMETAGILLPDERIELIRGEILVVSPSGPRHQAVIDRAAIAWMKVAGNAAIIRTQGTVVLDQFSAPEPDFALLRPRDDFYIHKHPGVEDIFLIIEVSDSSLEYDVTVKLALYAILRIEEYWVVDLQNNRILVYSDLQEDSYRTTREFLRGDFLAPRLLPECRISADVFLP